MHKSIHHLEKEKAIRAIVFHLDELRQKRPSLKLTEGKSAKTSQTLKKIIAATLDIFTREGHAGLSLRKVADKADIAVGNLTYHFPTKHALLDAMLCEVLVTYVEEHLTQFEADSDEPLNILMNVVAFYARNARVSHRFFYQMWGYAGSDSAAMDTVRNLYRPIGRFIYYLVRAANPKLKDADIRRVTLQIFSLEEGYKLFMGMGPEDDPAFQTAETDLRELTKKIVMGN
ncbi:MAG: hypothetical protein DHS20C05_07340 [Hyphococcus sp.]|nr:MAG: hypothetical protein DHS20C05_07340 [Marinicaulis sp.]